MTGAKQLISDEKKIIFVSNSKYLNISNTCSIFNNMNIFSNSIVTEGS